MNSVMMTSFHSSTWHHSDIIEEYASTMLSLSSSHSIDCLWREERNHQTSALQAICAGKPRLGVFQDALNVLLHCWACITFTPREDRVFFQWEARICEIKNRGHFAGMSPRNFERLTLNSMQCFNGRNTYFYDIRIIVKTFQLPHIP